jgi:hypothetical protein
MDNEFTTRYPFMYIEDYFVKLNNYMKKSYNIENVFKFLVEKYLIKNIDFNDLFPVCYAAIFSINKDAILDNSIDFYNNILNTILYDIRFNNSGKNKKLLDHGLYLEKLWLVIFNYKKYNKNYIKLPTKDFPIFDKYLTIKNNNNSSTIKFKLFNIYAQIYIEISIDNKLYKIFISRYIILFKDNNGKNLINYQPRENKNIQIILKNMNDIDFLINLKNNILSVETNNNKLFDYKFTFNVHKLTMAKIFSLTNNNKFKNLLNINNKTSKNKK